MGRPSIDNFGVMLEINPQGIVTGMRYWDQEGCGWDGPILPLTEPLDMLAKYHLEHCRQSHNLRPSVMCDFEIEFYSSSGDEKQGKMTCTLEKHGAETKHSFQM